MLLGVVDHELNLLHALQKLRFTCGEVVLDDLSLLDVKLEQSESYVLQYMIVCHLLRLESL